MILVCARQVCKGSFEATQATRRYCSEQCRRIDEHARRGKRITVARRLLVGETIAGNCARCGDAFERRRPRAGPRPKYCCDNCKDWKDTGIVRARAAGAEVDFTVTKAEICERDGWKCRHCGVETPSYLSGTRDRNAPEIDHIVPLAKGGPHIRGNLWLLCRLCNTSKGPLTYDGWREIGFRIVQRPGWVT